MTIYVCGDDLGAIFVGVISIIYNNSNVFAVDLGVGLAMADVDYIRKKYHDNRMKYEDLLRETNFILCAALQRASIKVHNINFRVKELESLIKKCDDKKINNPFDEIKDIAGIRIVCLFRSDLKSIEGVIKENFELIDIDNKVKDSDGFGYMSVHYICKMRADYSGPRYDYIRDIAFEVQARTICVDAWAAVSHYLSYKGNWDVPEDLRRAMNALSGLFYVADNEFLQVYSESLKSKQKAISLIENEPKKEIPINFDTIQAYLADKFKDRKKTSDVEISKIVHQLVESGYKNVDQINEDVDNTLDYLKLYEKSLISNKSLKSKFSSVGALRVSLAIANEEMERSRDVGSNYEGYDQPMKDYRELYLSKHKDRSKL